MRYIIKMINRMVPMPTPKILIVVSSVLIGFGRELISFRSPTVTPPGTVAVATPWSTDPKSGSDYQVVMLLTPAAHLSILRANHGQWMTFSIKAVMLTG